MHILHQVLEECLRNVPEQVLGEIVARKLRDHGVELSPTEQKKILKQIVSGKSEIPFRRSQRENQVISIEFTDDDCQQAEEATTKVLAGLHGVIEGVAETLTTPILETLRKRWRNEWRQQRRLHSGFQQRLYARWKTPLDLLRMLLTIARELGGSANEDAQKSVSSSSPHLVYVLTRLHARACQVTEEILTLLTAGFADGAMARWRTLHEIAVVASFISSHGEELAERYVQHQHVESKRAMQKYLECQDRLGYEPLTDADTANSEREYSAAVARFGTPFRHAYGWAAAQLGIEKPNFSQIEKAVGVEHLRAHFQMASNNGHANPKGAFFRLGLLRESAVLLAGPSNAGLADPGDSAAHSLVLASTTLMVINPTLDNLVGLRIMLKLRGEIATTFADAHQQLIQDEFGGDRGSPQAEHS